MSLALWMFDWSWGGGGEPAPDPEPAPAVVASAGGGNCYHLDDDFWETRERYIRRMLQATADGADHAQDDAAIASLDTLPDAHTRSELPSRDVRPSPYASIALEQALERQARAVAIAHAARTRAELQRAGALIAATSRALTRLKDQHEIENIATVMVLMF